MSEPLSSYEIEDVLSSIRRLVSEGRRPGVAASAAADAPTGPAPTGVAEKPASDPLLLTPALRVVPFAPSPVEPMPAAAPAAPPIMTLVSSRRVENDVPAPEDLPDDESTEWSDIAWQAHVAEESHLIEDSMLVTAAPFRHGQRAQDVPAAVDPQLVAQVEAQIVDTLARGETLVTGPARIGLVDHALLQDMVRELIREELRGPFGARVTRNLRKMIRAEINRAMSIRGSD